MTRDTHKPPEGPANLWNEVAEQALCGAALIAGEQVLILPAVRAVQPGDFWFDEPRWTWEAILAVMRAGLNPADPIVVLDELERQGRLDAVGMAGVGNLVNACGNWTNASDYATLVLDWAARRRVERAISDLGGALRTDGDFRGALRKAVEALEDVAVAGIGPPLALSDLLADTTPAPADVIEKFIPGRSVILFSGPGGDGKSYAMLDLAICVARGTPWLGLSTRKAPVLIVDLENRQPRMRERVEQTLRGHGLLEDPPPVFVGFDVGERLDTDAGVLEIAGQVERTGAGLVILDSLVDFLGDADENSNPAMARVAERMRAIVERTDASLAGIHHTPKNNALTPRGATALRDGIDVNILVSRDGNTLKMRQDKNRCGPEQAITALMNWGSGTFNLSLVGMSTGREEKLADKDEAAILEILQDGEWHSSNDVVKLTMNETRHARSTVSGKLRGMVDGEVLESDGEDKQGRAYVVRILR